MTPPLPTPPLSPFDARPGTFAPRFNMLSPDSQSFGIPLSYGFPLSYGLGIPGYVNGTASTAASTTAAERDPGGVLYMDLLPRSAQVFVDGAYVGMVEDLARRGLPLDSGRHHLSLEARGYETVAIDLSIISGQPLRYREDLVAVRQAAAAAPMPPHPPETMYVIPGCYGGNTPPAGDRLPRGCNIARVRVIRPPR